MPLVAFCLRHFLADFIICMYEFDFRQAQLRKQRSKDSRHRVGTRRPFRWALPLKSGYSDRIHSWGLASMAGNYFGEKIATHR
jgi:hypothetical protein